MRWVRGMGNLGSGGLGLAVLGNCRFYFDLRLVTHFLLSQKTTSFAPTRKAFAFGRVIASEPKASVAIHKFKRNLNSCGLPHSCYALVRNDGRCGLFRVSQVSH